MESNFEPFRYEEFWDSSAEDNNMWYCQAHKYSAFDVFDIRHSHQPDAKRFADQAIDLINATNDIPKVLAIDLNSYTDEDALAAVIDQSMPWIDNHFKAYNRDPSPWIYELKTQGADKVECPPAVIESAWAHAIIPEVMDYLRHNKDSIIQCLDCEDAMAILKKNLPIELSCRVYPEIKGAKMTPKTGGIVFSYYDSWLDPWIKKCNALFCLSWSAQFTNAQGIDKLLKYRNQFDADWVDPGTKRKRRFSLINYKHLLETAYELQHIQIKSSSSLKELIPDFKVVNGMRNVLTCFSVAVMLRDSPHIITPGNYYGEPCNAKFSEYEIGVTGNTWLGFDPTVFPPDINAPGKICIDAKVVKLKFVVTKTHTDVYCNMNHSGNCARRNYKSSGQGVIVCFAVMRFFRHQTWEGEIDTYSISIVSVVMAEFGGRYFIPPGTMPDWLLAIFDAWNFPIQPLTFHPENSYVVHPQCHGMFTVDDIYSPVRPSICKYVSGAGDPFNNAPMMMLGRSSPSSISAFRAAVGYFDAA